MRKRITFAGVGRWLLAAATVGGCLEHARAQEVAAKVLSLTGQVSVLRDNALWVLSPADFVQPRQVIVTGADGFAVFQLSDGSTFDVFPNSRVVFRDNPPNWRDLLEVLIGRVKVQIQKLGGHPNLHRVRTPTAVISVRGTVFDVQVEDAEQTTLIVVEEGQVAVEHKFHPSGKPRILNTGEWIRVFRNIPLAKSMLDKGSVLQGVFRAGAEALYEAVYRTSRPSAGGKLPDPADRTQEPPPGPPPPASSEPHPAPPPPPPR